MRDEGGRGGNDDGAREERKFRGMFLETHQLSKGRMQRALCPGDSNNEDSGLWQVHQMLRLWCERVVAFGVVF